MDVCRLAFNIMCFVVKQPDFQRFERMNIPYEDCEFGRATELNKQIIETLNKMFIKWLYYLWILHERDDV